MATSNEELMSQASAALAGKWGLAVRATLLYFVSIMAISFGLESLAERTSYLSFFLTAPMALGYVILSLVISRGEEARVERIFDGFNKYWLSLAAYLLMAIFTILWLLLLIVPGIIAAISYSQTFYLIADDKSMSAMEAIDKSKQMMYGYKLKYFYLCLRFLGLAFLCLLTLGIGFLWLQPYAQVTMAKFYDDIKNQPLPVETV